MAISNIIKRQKVRIKNGTQILSCREEDERFQELNNQNHLEKPYKIGLFLVTIVTVFF